jgi:hypothetical protein
VIERWEHGIKHGRWKAGLDQVSHLQAWVRVLRLKYISKSSKTNKNSQASGVGSASKAKLLYSGVSASPAASSPGRAWALYWCFFGPQRASLPITRSTRRSRLQCVTKGKCALFQATLLEDGNRWFRRHPHIGTFYLDDQAKEMKDTSFRLPLTDLP